MKKMIAILTLGLMITALSATVAFADNSDGPYVIKKIEQQK